MGGSFSPDLIFGAVLVVLGLTVVAFALVLFSLVRVAFGKRSSPLLSSVSIIWIAIVVYTLLWIVPPRLDALLNGFTNQTFHNVPEEHRRFHETLSGKCGLLWV